MGLLFNRGVYMHKKTLLMGIEKISMLGKGGEIGHVRSLIQHASIK